ncbi:MAG: DUF4845 domain-containing protein [Pseudohongiella sp.]|nr:DUF4845 domain-containing protein [Pseudohongiella sp.]
MQHPAGSRQHRTMSNSRNKLRNWVKITLVAALMLPLTIGTSRVFEAYLEYFFILQTLRLTVTEPDLHTRSALQVQQDVIARLRLLGISTLNAEQLAVIRQNDVTLLRVRYSVELMRLGSHIATLHFDETLP